MSRHYKSRFRKETWRGILAILTERVSPKAWKEKPARSETWITGDYIRKFVESVTGENAPQRL